jgi:hypothetical protein
MTKHSPMSIKTSSIADALKNTSSRRNPPAVESFYDQEPEYPSNDTYDDRSPNQSDEYNEYDEPLESPPSRPTYQSKNTQSKSARTDDLIGRLNRLSQDRPETGSSKSRYNRPPEDEETHRATSRQRRGTKNELPRVAKRVSNSHQFDDNEETEDESHSNRYQSRSRATENSEDEYDQSPVRTSRRTVRRAPEPVQRKNNKTSARSYQDDEPRRTAGPVLSRGRRSAQQPTQRKVQQEPHRQVKQQTRNTRRPEPEFEEDYFDDHSAAEERDEKRHESLADDLPVFNALSKTSITAASKYAGVQSMEAGVYETVKNLVGQFVYNVLERASKDGSGGKVSSQQLEAAVEQVMGRSIDELEDLSQSFVNNKAFLKWLDGLTSNLDLTLLKEANMFLEQCVDFYLVELLANAKEVAESQRKSRVTTGHIQMASRMR